MMAVAMEAIAMLLARAKQIQCHQGLMRRMGK